MTLHAHIDADIFTYSFGSCKNDEGKPLAWPLVATRLNAQIKNIVDAAGCNSYDLFLTGGSNFRSRVATIQPYKGTRPSEKPHWYSQIRSYLLKFRGAELIEGYEADDELSIRQTNDTVLCSLDKDLDMVVGKHYNWTRDKLYEVTRLSGLVAFYSQLLTGDRVDNILGLHGVGGKSSAVKRVNACDSEPAMLSVVLGEYEKRYGAYGWGFLKENAALLWMLTEYPKDIECPENEVYDRLEALRPQVTALNWRRRLLSSLSSTK